MEENILNGFEAIFDTLTPMSDREDNKPVKGVKESNESLTDEELEMITKSRQQKTVDTVEEEETEDTEDNVEETKTKNRKANKQSVEVEEEEDDEVGSESESEDIDEHESTMVTGFFDALSEKIGWDSEEEEKPKTVEELIEYFQDVITENSTPAYASEEIGKLDEFVKNGGDLKSFLTIEKEMAIEDYDITDENDQKSIVKQLLFEKGFNDKQIARKITRYEEAGVLEEEAEDAIEELGTIREAKKERLLADQQKAAEDSKKKQQEFFTSVVNEIKGMKDVRGISIPEKDKNVLMEYIFKPDTDGKTKYQKDYAKNIKNLIESAYFTMKGDTLVESAKSKGKKDAISSFKNSLKNSGGIGKKSKKEIKNTDDSMWSSFTRQLRVA